MLLDVETNEDLELIKNSFNEFLSREWNKYGSKKHEVSRDKIMEVFGKVKDLGIFQFIRETGLTNALLLNEIIGENLLPGIVAFSSMLGVDYLVSVGVNYVAEVDKAEAIVTPKGISNKNDVDVEEIESPDPSVRVYKIIEGEWRKSDFDFNKVILLASAQIIGHATAVLKETVEYSKNRIAFGKPIGSYQAIKHRIVDDALRIELVRSRYLVNPTSPERIFKHAYKKAFKAILNSIQSHGGIGFTADLDLHLHLKRVILLGKLFQQ
ncbi:acyl-CoA dehydrogenase [Saccharolobus solfataricus]|uniref:Acyl-CoA dehydrogenase related protein (Acd-like1) n=3 Tax=Saccharolobus solfataricus TaxID=2287 RepID=Q97YZ3_SACS2|nr:acyl-CoA dehydrogenase family protein [Saccharolobus solfataricus]AAK41407.1 Acyl-CoA dehydrogenase related protein (acd-like1) [Saccharolobus solfataricus P2]AKA74349.1 acyl-CoA dehydrogenase [Saccharolobus solfataricus]AKA77045.1 acyl-CoA dehydrogenase [Saccharolobus solfataricus]AKA79737.1 acyl-CoA dehydrogenase [Saccharolobus solfataricus]AZF68832.1 acyl-CoA dehydrogenase [Saccharolobus solfataricus]